MNREMTVDPPMVFSEKQPVEVAENEPQQFVTRVVRRDPSITNAMLPSEHDRCLGTAILNRLDEVFGKTPSALPVAVAGNRVSSDEILSALQQLVKLFLVNGYAWDGGVARVETSSASGQQQFCLTLTSPASLWGTRSLQQEGRPLLNDYL